MIDRTKFIELPQKVWLVYDTHKKDKFAHIEKAFLSEQASSMIMFTDLLTKSMPTTILKSAR